MRSRGLRIRHEHFVSPPGAAALFPVSTGVVAIAEIGDELAPRLVEAHALVARPVDPMSRALRRNRAGNPKGADHQPFRTVLACLRGKAGQTDGWRAAPERAIGLTAAARVRAHPQSVAQTGRWIE